VMAEGVCVHRPDVKKTLVRVWWWIEHLRWVWD
jgi:hypothetical protein